MPEGATSAAMRERTWRRPAPAAASPAGGAVAALVVAAAALPARSATTTVLPRRADVASLTAKVADAYRSGRPCGTTGCAITSRWDDAVLMVGMVEHWRTFRRTQDRTYAVNWANANALAALQRPERRPEEPELAQPHDGGIRLSAPARGRRARRLDRRRPREFDAQLALRLTPEREQLVDYVFPGQSVSSFSWKAVDAEYLALPTWILMGKRTGGTAYLDRARDLQDYQVEVMGLRDPETGLWFRDEAHEVPAQPERREDRLGPRDRMDRCRPRLRADRAARHAPGIRRLPDPLRRADGRGPHPPAPGRLLEHEPSSRIRATIPRPSN